MTGDRQFDTLEAPIQKFRWIHFPWQPVDGTYRYRATRMHMPRDGQLVKGTELALDIAQAAVTYDGVVDVGFTRNFASSQAYREQFDNNPDIIPEKSEDGLDFVMPDVRNGRGESVYDWLGFEARQLIHDIHMNQGNPPGRFAGDNGIFQDGALFFQFPDDAQGEQWVAVFLKFQSQAWHSDDELARPAVPQDPEHRDEPHAPIRRDRIPALDVPDGLVRIVAALVNDVRTPEHETVTLLNTADVAVSLDGWMIKDKRKNAMTLAGEIAPGATMTVPIEPPVALSNRGGIIPLLDAKGIKVHGVAYTKTEASQPGRTIPFQN